MQQEKIKKIYIITAVLFWIFTALCMAVIFWFSSCTADTSAGQSNIIIQLICKIFGVFGEDSLMILVVRKSAHCLEYAGLAFLFNCAWYFTRNQRSLLLSVICTSLYAVTDEFHQLFVEGRSCEFKDWAIDTGGAVIGMLGFLVIYLIISAVVKKKKSVDTEPSME